MNAPVKSPEDMQVVLLDIEALLPYARNSKDHSPAQVEIIAGSIKRFGWTNPCLVADGVIIAGHGRVMAAKKLGLKRVPCIDVGHLSEDDRRAYVIMDNRSAETGASWNLEMLKLETDYLRESGFDLEAATGFAEEDLAKLFEGMDDVMQSEGDGDPDDVPDAPVVPHSRVGDIWVCGDHRIACGDSCSLEVWDKLMQGESARLCATDPPYNVNYESELAGKIKNDSMSNSDFRKFLKAAYDVMFAVMEPGAPLYVAHSDTEGHNFRSAAIDAGFKLSGCLIWCKNSLVLGRSDFQWRHEPIIYLWKPGAKHFWYGGRKRTTIIEYGEGSPFQKREDGRWAINVGGKTLVVNGDVEVEEHLGSVIYHDKPSRSELHPTTKPVNLWLKFIEPSSRRGDIVIDPFSGSGTTMIACEMSGRKARVCDLDEKFVDVAVRRWEMLTGRKAVHAVTGEPFPAEGALRVTVEAVTAPVAPVTGDIADPF